MNSPNNSHGVTRIGGSGIAAGAPRHDSLADVLERVLDKGVVVVGDIGVSILDIELLSLKVRLLIASADTAREMGIDWWLSDPFFSTAAAQSQQRADELERRIAELEQREAGGTASQRRTDASRTRGRADG